MAALRFIAAPLAACIIAACGYDSTGASNAPPPPPQNPTTDITMRNNTFSPNPKTVALGGNASVAIRWVNLDYDPNNYGSTGVQHNVVSDDNPAAFSPSSTLNANQTYTVQLSAPGDYPYHCTLHPGMTGTIHVNP
jgi:plastocyanin